MSYEHWMCIYLGSIVLFVFVLLALLQLLLYISFIFYIYFLAKKPAGVERCCVPGTSFLPSFRFRPTEEFQRKVKQRPLPPTRDWCRVGNLLRTNERLWANHSGRSWHMSECERFAQKAQDKWANERIAQFFWANRSFSLLLTKYERFAQKNFVRFLQFFKFF